MTISAGQEGTGSVATLRRFVRVTARREHWVEFEFSIGDPALCVELIMQPEQFAQFCRANQAERLTEGPDEQREQERRKWHEHVPGAQP